MVSGPVAFLGFTCWNVHWPSSSLVLSHWKSSSSADPVFKISWICLCFCEKSWWSKRLKNWFNSLTLRAVFTEMIFCVLPFTYLLINFIPLHTLLILLYVKWLFILYTVPLRISSFSSFCTDLYSSLSFFWNSSFFLLMMPLILLVILGLLLRNSFTVFCGIVHSTQKSIYPHTDWVSSLISLDESTKTPQSVQSKDPLSFSTASSDHSFIVQVTVRPLCTKGLYLGISWTMLQSDRPSRGRDAEV